MLDVQALHLGQTFDYFIDEKDSEAAQPGVLVRVRFGGQRVSGVIWHAPIPVIRRALRFAISSEC